MWNVSKYLRRFCLKVDKIKFDPKKVVIYYYVNIYFKNLAQNMSYFKNLPISNSPYIV